MADVVPVFPLYSTPPCIPDRSLGAGGPALRTSGVPPQKLRKLEAFVGQYGLLLAEAVPLFAALLSLPLSPAYDALPSHPRSRSSGRCTRC